MMVVLNTTRNAVLVNSLKVAQNVFQRLRGLIGSPPLEKGEGFLIPHCQGIHTFGVGYPIDVVYLDGNEKVLCIFKSLPPNSFGCISFRACFVLELPPGVIDHSGTRVGDLFSISNGS